LNDIVKLKNGSEAAHETVLKIMGIICKMERKPEGQFTLAQLFNLCTLKDTTTVDNRGAMEHDLRLLRDNRLLDSNFIPYKDVKNIALSCITLEGGFKIHDPIVQEAR